MSAPRPASPGFRRPRTLLVRLVRLYPARWRRRYGDEYEALLEYLPATPSTIADLVAGAFDAHVHSIGWRWRSPAMLQRLRSAELTVFASWVAFVLAGLGFRKMTEDPPFTTAGASQPLLWVAFGAVVAGAGLALLAVVAGGAPIAVAIARSALRDRRRGPLALLAVPPLALVAWLGLVSAALQLHPGQSDAAVRLGAFVLLEGGLVVAAAASTAAVSAAAARAEIDPGLYRFAVRPAVAVAAAMALASLGVLAWGVGLLVELPSAFWGDGGVLATTTAASWAVILVVMAAATMLALFGAALAVRAGAGTA